MRKIKIEYRNWGFWHTKKIDVPEEMNQMSQEQMISVTRFYLGEMTQSAFISLFFGISKRLVRKLNAFQQFKLIELVDFTRQEDAICTEMIVNRPDGKKHASCPLRMLRNTSFKQFMLIDTCFSAYASGKDEKMLKNFMEAVFCFETDESIETDKATMLAVFFNWLFIKNMLSARFPLLFPEGSGEENPGVVRWLDIFDSFVGEDVAHMYDYERMQAMDVLRIMNRRIKEYNNRKLKVPRYR